MNQPFDTVLELYQQGQILSAWDAGRFAGELPDWPAPDGRLLASRLATHLGNERLARLLQLRTYRAYPRHPEARYFFVSRVHGRRGALAAWESQTAIGPPQTDEPKPRWLYHGQRALILADLRDFETAEHHLREAYDAEPERAWFYVERAYVSERSDRIPDALGAAQRALALSPQYQPAISSTARCLHLLGRTDEAIGLLEAKSRDTQSSYVVAHLIHLLIDADRLDEAEALLPRYEALTPLRDRDANTWIANQHITFAQRRGEYAAALRYAETIDQPFFEAVAGNVKTFLQDGDDGAPRQKLLDVPFVRQHHLTCAPATLSALSQFWGKPVEHLAVAETICYDGTPMHSERRWAEENGFYVREFRVDWDSTIKLIELGIPFTLVVSEAVYGHLQAVVGYDRPLGIIFIRDPQTEGLVTANARGLYATQESVGPRGMAMVPADRAHLLADLQLPETELYESYHAMQLALEEHDRDRAIEHWREMVQREASHRLTLTARRALATYDEDTPAVLEVLDRLHERYPKDPALRLARLQVLRQLSTREYRLIWLDGIVRDGLADPLLLMEYAVELGIDDRDADKAMWYLRRALRRRPDDSIVIHAMAELLWNDGRREEAIAYYRHAACLSETREAYSQSYFTACRWAGQTDVALGFLRTRFELVGSRSSLPARSLFSALEQLEQIEQAFGVLERARDQRPDDGDLLLFAALKRAQYGEAELARQLLAAAEGRVKRADWLAAAAQQARLAGDRATALDLWREITKIEPLHLGAHRMIAFLLSESQTRDAALAHLRSMCEVFPHHAGLHHLLYEWTEGDPASEREGVLRHLLAIDPADAWSHRELALNLHRQSRFEEALESANEALALDSRHAGGYTIKGHVLRSVGKVEEATACYRTAVRTWADAPGAIHGLLETCGDTIAKRKEVLELVASELLAQPAVGDGFLKYREVARAVLTPSELLESLERAHRERADLWQVRSALSQHLADMGRLDEALRIAQEATQRFPRLPRAWADLSRVHELRLEPEQQIAALTRCRELSPDWADPAHALSVAFERQGRRDEAIRVLESAISRTPLEVSLRGQLAALHHRAGDTDRAIETITEVLRISPDFEPGWQQLAAWSAECGENRVPLEMATQIAEARPGEYAPRVRLAGIQFEIGELEAALESLEWAIGIAPRSTFAHDEKAHVLTMLRRYRDAEQACTPPIFGDSPPLNLRGRAAWVDAQRGDYTTAIARMEALVEQNPDYEWGWYNLMEWHAQLGQHRQAMKAAERLAWLDPTNMIAQGWLGDMMRKLRNDTDAKRVFRRAMEFQPGYLFAGFQYFDILLKEADFDEAERTLEILGVHAAREEILAARVRLHIARKQRDAALEVMRQLCLDPEFDDQALETAAAAFASRGWHRPLEGLLKKVMREPQWHPAVPALWAGSSAERGRFGGVFRYRFLASLGTPGLRAINRVLVALGDRGRLVEPAMRFAHLRFRWHIRLIRWICHAWEGDDLYWGNVGYALICLRRYRSIVSWMRQWTTRANVEFWMLQNLTIALLRRGEDQEARRVLRFIARDLTLTQDVSAYLKIWCVLGACLDGDWDLADRLLHEAPPDLIEEQQMPLRDFAKTALAVLRTPAGTGKLDLKAELTIKAAVAAFTGNVAPLRLINLLRVRIGKHTRRRWMVFAGWRGLYPKWATLSAAAAVLVLYLLVKIFMI